MAFYIVLSVSLQEVHKLCANVYTVLYKRLEHPRTLVPTEVPRPCLAMHEKALALVIRVAGKLHNVPSLTGNSGEPGVGGGWSPTASEPAAQAQGTHTPAPAA